MKTFSVSKIYKKRWIGVSHGHYEEADNRLLITMMDRHKKSYETVEAYGKKGDHVCKTYIAGFMMSLGLFLSANRHNLNAQSMIVRR